MTKFAKGLLAALLVPACLLCAGCDGTAEEADSAPEAQAASDAESGGLSNGCYDADHYLRECEIRLHDGRKVTCVMNVFNSDEGGLSCDWGHADKTE